MQLLLTVQFFLSLHEVGEEVAVSLLNLVEEIVETLNFYFHDLGESVVHLGQGMTVVFMVHALYAHGHIALDAEIFHVAVLMLDAYGARNVDLRRLLDVGIIIANRVPSIVHANQVLARIPTHRRLSVRKSNVVIGLSPSSHDRWEEPIFGSRSRLGRHWETTVVQVLLILAKRSSITLELLRL